MIIRLRQITAAAFATAFVISCGGGETTEPDNTVASVSVTGATSIAPAGTTQLTATPKNAAGTALAGLTATWSTSASAVATVSATGLVTGVANGTATITATIAGVPGTRNITVQSITPVTSATVAVQGQAFSPSQVDLTAGGQVTWNFQDQIDHNVTFDAVAGAPSNIGNTSSGSQARTFATAGTFPYHCTIHAGMNGTIVVH
jgi:plastocyanin